MRGSNFFSLDSLFITLLSSLWPLPGFAVAEHGGITKHYMFHTSLCPLKLEGGDFGSILLYVGKFSNQIAECYKIVP